MVPRVTHAVTPRNPLLLAPDPQRAVFGTSRAPQLLSPLLIVRATDGRRDIDGLKQKLATDLVHVAGLKDHAVLEGDEALAHALQHAHQGATALIFRARAEGESALHAERGIEALGRICVYGERARGLGLVHGDQRGGATADNGNESGHGEMQEGGGRDGGCKGTDVFLAVLLVCILC